MKSISIFLFSAFVLIAIKGISQDYIYPLQGISDPSQTPIELISDDPDFVAWCLKSEFGKPKISYSQSETKDEYGNVISYNDPIFRWNNLNRLTWSARPFSISVTISSYQTDHGYGRRVPHIKIEFKDVAGNDLLKPGTKADTEIRRFLQKLLFQSHSYVNSSDGVNVRQQPSTTASVVTSLPDYSKVIIKERTNIWIDVQKQGEAVKSEWVKVYVNENVTGYVAGVFLIPFYEVHPSDIKVLNDSIARYAVIEKIEYGEAQKKKILSSYSIDTTSVAIPAPPKDSYRGSLRGFYLPIKNGTDSLYFYDRTSEYGITQLSYAGRIPILDLYVIYSYHIFGDRVILYDVKTGAEKFSIHGLPHISPDGGLLVDNYSFQDPESSPIRFYTAVYVSSLKSNESFKSFAISSDKLHFSVWGFWLSNNEILIEIDSRTGHADFINYADQEKIDFKGPFFYYKLKIK